MTSQMRSRKDLKEQLLKRGEESYERKDDSGRFGSIFRKDLKGVKFWKCGEGEHQIDILPWLIGNQYPSKNYTVEPGDPVYLLDIWVHYNIGPDEDTVVCLSKNYGNPCPICEHVNALRKEEVVDDNLIDRIKAKRRSIYQIICYDSASEEEKGVQIWDVAYFFMEKHLAELSKKPKGGGYITFADPDDGKQIFYKRKGTGMTNTEYIAHQFMDREYKIHDDDLDACIALDDAIIVLPYEELYEKHWGGLEDKTAPPEVEERPARQARRSRPEPEKKKEDERPARRARRDTPEPEKEKHEDPKQHREPDPDNKCPGGGQYAIDIDKLEHCNVCKAWDDCASEANAREKAEKEQKVPETVERRRRPV
jgi:hypothetical protein